MISISPGSIALIHYTHHGWLGVNDCVLKINYVHCHKSPKTNPQNKYKKEGTQPLQGQSKSNDGQSSSNSHSKGLQLDIKCPVNCVCCWYIRVKFKGMGRGRRSGGGGGYAAQTGNGANALMTHIQGTCCIICRIRQIRLWVKLKSMVHNDNKNHNQRAKWGTSVQPL